MELLTRLEEIILLSIRRLRDEAYGVTINREVSELMKKNYTMGSLYFSLDQLYRKGLVDKCEGEPTPERGGRKKIYYSLTKKGERALQSVLELHMKAWENYEFGK